MIKTAEFQTLIMSRSVEFGVYLKDKEGEGEVLLPKKQVPEGLKVGDEIEVFVYKDSNDRLIATVNKPFVTLHKVARLKVSQVTKIGAFLDWGLEKDLFLPFAQQTYRVKEGDEILVSVYIDKSERVAATMKIYPYLENAKDIKAEDVVEGTVYEISDNFGAFVAIDDKYQGLIPKRELYGDVEVGRKVNARVISVREDGKVNLSIRKKSYLQIESDAEKLIEIIKSYDGVLPFTDKASPEVIKRETGMSKNEFKKAVGNLYKNRVIEITENNKIRLI
ncbi:MAG: S1 RNA-binding domain-containing protein [Lachnospiraceae bacterium]|nr:S1 RNA-binding domain-containing protein [Lachnospiraceae bacterium]